MCTASGRRNSGIINRSAMVMLCADASPSTAIATPPFSAKLVITCARSSLSSSRRMLRTGMKATSPPFTASNAGGRVLSAHAHSTRRSSPAPPASSSVPSGSTLRHTSLTVTVGALTWASETLEILVEFPWGHVTAVLTPLQTLGFYKALGQVVTQRVDHDVIGGERGDGIAEAVRQHPDGAALELDVIKPGQGLLDRGRQRQAALDAVETAAQHHGERQVRVARRIRAAQLDSRRLRPAHMWNPDERASIGARPRDEDGRFEARHKTLV